MVWRSVSPMYRRMRASAGVRPARRTLSSCAGVTRTACERSRKRSRSKVVIGAQIEPERRPSSPPPGPGRKVRLVSQLDLLHYGVVGREDRKGERVEHRPEQVEARRHIGGDAGAVLADVLAGQLLDVGVGALPGPAAFSGPDLLMISAPDQARVDRRLGAGPDLPQRRRQDQQPL